MSKENLLKSFDEKKPSNELVPDHEKALEIEVTSIKEESIETERLDLKDEMEIASQPHDSIEYLKDCHVGSFLQGPEEITHFPVF